MKSPVYGLEMKSEVKNGVKEDIQIICILLGCGLRS